jgi:hypothetical protein
MLAGLLYVPPIADLLDQAGPTWPGFAVALLAAPAVLAADTVHKARRRCTDQGDQGDQADLRPAGRDVRP